MSAHRDTVYRDDLGRVTPCLRQVARALVQDHAAAQSDDLVQATLIRALAADERRCGDRLTIWLLSQMVGLHRTQVHALSASHRISAGGRVSSPVWRHASGSAAAGHDGSGLGSLPLELREVLVLVALAPLTYMQVAEVLGLSITAVVARLARGRDLLVEMQDRGREVAAYAGGAMAGASRPRRAAAHLRLVK